MSGACRQPLAVCHVAPAKVRRVPPALTQGVPGTPQVASWAVGGPGEAAWLRCGAAPHTAVTLSAAGRLQWWDLAMLRVRAS